MSNGSQTFQKLCTVDHQKKTLVHTRLCNKWIFDTKTTITMVELCLSVYNILKLVKNYQKTVFKKKIRKNEYLFLKCFHYSFKCLCTVK